MVAVAWWAACRALEGAAVLYEIKLTFGKLTYLGIASVAPLWLMATLSYCGLDRWLTRRRIMVLWIIPVITMALALTYDWHDWLWSQVLPAADLPGGNLIYQRGWWWYLTVACNYTLLAALRLAGAPGFVDGARIAPSGGSLIIAVVVPWTANILNLLQAGGLV
jgi:hypothetical protein